LLTAASRAEEPASVASDPSAAKDTKVQEAKDALEKPAPKAPRKPKKPLPPAWPMPFDERFVLDTGRIPTREPTPDTTTFQVHGEAQFQLQAMSNLPLQQRIGAAPGEGANLGTNWRLLHWLRVKPIFQFRDKLRIVGEIDIPAGMVAGQLTQLVSAARDDYAKLLWYEVHPRQLYLEYMTPVGLVRVGHQTSYWGMGLIANDGDHPQLFGEYRRGSITERLLFATKPMGKDSPLTLAIAGDLVFQDSRASLVGDIPRGVTPADELGAGDANAEANKGRDRALQVVGAVRWKQNHFEAGVYGVYRYQERTNRSTDDLTKFTEQLQVGVIDFAGKFDVVLPGTRSFLFGEWELAYIGGKTNYVRNVELLQAGRDERIISWGGAGKVGVVRVNGTGKGAWGDVVVAVEYGYASGDADPYDGITRRFTMDQNHNVGLIMFDQVLAWKTARAATIAQDPRITYRPSPGLEFLPSEGAVFGAAYVNPTIVVRPKRWLDLKGGVVIGQTTADFVDPFHVGALGSYANYEGGSPKKHDLGLELDLGADVRIPVRSGFGVNGGVEGAVFFPGGAFDDALGARLPKQFLVNTKLGVQF
jgi:hypothetical protein